MPISDIEYCLNNYVHGEQGGDPTATHAPCPMCGKIITIKLDGTLYAHGVTRKKIAERALPAPYRTEPDFLRVDEEETRL